MYCSGRVSNLITSDFFFTYLKTFVVLSPFASITAVISLSDSNIPVSSLSDAPVNSSYFTVSHYLLLPPFNTHVIYCGTRDLILV